MTFRMIFVMVAWFFGLTIFILVSLWIRGSHHLKLLHELWWDGLSAWPLWITGVLSVLLIVMGRSSLSSLPRVSSLIKFSVLSWCVGIMAISSVVHQIDFTQKNRPMEETFKQVRAMTGSSPLKILAPIQFWFEYGDSMRNVDAVVLDYYYSGVMRPWSCLERYKPDYLILDEQALRRFFVRKAADGTVYMEPIGNVLRTPFARIGEIKGNLHHSPLQVFKLEWPLEKKKP